MNFILYKKMKMNEKEFHSNLLNILGLFPKTFVFYLDVKNDTIHYLLFGKKIELIQIIFQSKTYSIKDNFNILDYAFKYKKIARNYISCVDKITQYNFILYENERNFECKDWIFKEENNIFPNDIYNVKVYNLFYIQKKERSIYKKLSNLIYNL